MSAGRQSSAGPDHDVLVIGAGFAGLYALHRLRTDGWRVRVLERGDGIGGTWFWNRYPGARCDVESMDYSYSFSPELEQDWQWTERYPAQPEILAYLQHVAERFDLLRDIELGTEVTAAEFDDHAALWRVTTAAGATVTARYVVMAGGNLSAPRDPDIPGLDTFAGRVLHTARWPHEEPDLAGARVGVIGTGSSGTQAVPVLAERAAHLTVFQRTANFSLPAHNQPLDPEVAAELKARYRDHREQVRYSRNGQLRAWGERSALEVTPEERDKEYEARWQVGGGGFIGAFRDLLADERANDTAADFVRGKIREIVHDPAVAERLVPSGFPIGAKRVTVDTGYYATYNRPGVELVDVRADPIEAIHPGGIRTASGDDHPLDVLVLATGFDAMTGAVLAIDVRGRDGLALGEKWAAGPRTYLGLLTAGFPNLFLITGPGSPSVLSNMVVSIEQHVDWVADLLGALGERGHDEVEARPDAEDRWVAHVNELSESTLFPRGNSWYLGANVPGKPRVFMPYVGGVGTYRRHCEDVAAQGYPGLTTRDPAAR
ncbi:NAD(P)/FAD-dependent oxidoreductase [Pseudonocardia nematodicida]|uniref:NAD(P)/FAD-dependent oxidoreductase n=1 Tax=Pseudonocardia nematodicida TaxID=1206997 RepID=A0ABV1K4Z9_9PSEU